MPCFPITDKENKYVGFICGGHPIYRYNHKGREYIFEVHHYCGPTWLRKDLEPRKYHCPRPGHPFWDMLEEFEKLSKEEKEKICV